MAGEMTGRMEKEAVRRLGSRPRNVVAMQCRSRFWWYLFRAGEMAGRTGRKGIRRLGNGPRKHHSLAARSSLGGTTPWLK